MITAQQRIRMIILIEKMNRHKGFSEKLGIEDISKYHGERITRKESEKIC